MKTTFHILLLLILMLPQAFAVEPGEKEGKDNNLYSSFGKRDPFRIPDRGGLGSDSGQIDPLRRFRLEGYRLRAILRSGNQRQAMFEDPGGKSHIVVEGDRLGMEGARVSRIVNSEVIVTERSSNYLGNETLLEKVISLPPDTENGQGAETRTTSTVQQGYPGTEKPSEAKADPTAAK